MISVSQARAHYPDGDPVHGFAHVLRVLSLAQQIGPKEGADMVVLEAAVLLHDVARAQEVDGVTCHAQMGAQRARQILAGHPPAQVEAVAEAIRTHRFREALPPTTLEGRILYDADKLDAMGAMGIARAYAMAGQTGQELWAEVKEGYATRERLVGRGDSVRGEHTPVHEFAFKLVKLRDTLFTATARQMAEDRHDFMHQFFDRLSLEVRGEL